MRPIMIFNLLLAAALLSGQALAQSQPPEPSMPHSRAEVGKARAAAAKARAAALTAGKTDPSQCSDKKAHDGNGGIVFGRGGNARGGTGNIGRNTGNGGVVLGDQGDASGGDSNLSLNEPCDSKVSLGNGGVAVGRGVKASGGSGNIVKF